MLELGPLRQSSPGQGYPSVGGITGAPGLEFHNHELLGCRVLSTLEDALHTQKALTATLHAPDQAGLSVWAARRAAVDLQTSLTLAFSILNG